MTSKLLTLLPVLAALTGLAACDQPKWRDKPATAETAKAKVVTSDAVATPAAPVWSQAMIGKALREVFPATGLCKGNTDIVQKVYTGVPAGVQLHGWGWDLAKKARIERVILVDRTYRIVGAGEGGVARADVPTAIPEITDPSTGWNADIALKSGPLDAYGITGDNSICVLGHIEF